MNKLATSTISVDDQTFGLFAIKLISIKTNPQLDNFVGNHKMNLTRLVNMLYDPDSNISYCVRTIIDPQSASDKLGTINIALIVKFGFDPKEINLQIRAEIICKSLRLILGGLFDYYIWKEIVDQSEFSELLNPLDWASAYTAELRRKEEFVQLEKLTVSKPIGFSAKNLDTRQNSSLKTVYYIHPFSTTINSFERLLRTLMFGTEKIVFTSILTPTRLTSEEFIFFQEQIAYCEGYQPQENSIIRIYDNRANMLSQALLKQQLLLQESSFMLTFNISSEQPLDSLLLEYIGQAISEPYGISNFSHQNFETDGHLLGGHLVSKPQNSYENCISQQNMSKLAQNFWGKVLNHEYMERLPFLFDGIQATNMFTLPITTKQIIPGIASHHFVDRPIPREMLALTSKNSSSIQLGINHHYGFEQEVFISEETRQQHTYVVGQTGTGKTTLLKTMILSDMKAGNGLAVIDPHGEMYQDLLEMIPESRKEDVVLLDPSDRNCPVGLNLLQISDEEDREYIIKEMRAILKRYINEYFHLPSGEYAGPVFFQHVQNNMLLATSDLENPSTIIEFLNIFQSDDFWKRWLPLKWKNPLLKNWVEEGLPNTRYSRMDKGGRLGDYFSSKFMDFANDPRLAIIFGQPYSTIDFDDIIDNKKIFLVNLSKGLLGEASSSMLGMILMAKINASFMRRLKTTGNGNSIEPFYLYVDEFQNIATENFSILLAEARKFGLGLILANQYIRQITDYKIREAIFGNVGTIVSFRLGIDDAKIIESQFFPEYDFQELCNLPNYTAVMRTNIKGKRTNACNFQTLLPNDDEGFLNKNLVIDLSQKKYGVPRNLGEIILESASSKQRLDNSKLYWEKVDTPKDQMIRNVDPKVLLGISGLSSDEQDVILRDLETIMRKRIIFYFIYKKYVCKHCINKAIIAIEESEIMIVEDLQTVFNNFFKPEFKSLSDDFFGIYNSILKERIEINISNLQNMLDKEKIIDKINYIKDMCDSDRWLDACTSFEALLVQENINIDHQFKLDISRY